MGHKINNTMTEALMLLSGGVVGAGLALLLAPQAGRKTRNEIARYGKALGRKSDKAVHEFADTVADFADSVGKKASGILRTGEELTREGKKEVLAALERGGATISNQKRRLERMIA